MNEPRDPGMAALAADLRALGAEIAYPPTPDFTTSVRAVLGGGARDDRPEDRASARDGGRRRAPLLPVRLARPLLLAAALVLLLAAVAVGAFVVLRGLAIIPVATLPPATPVLTVGPGDPGSGLGLGRRVELADVAEVAGFVPRIPAATLPGGVALGAPDAAWVATGTSGARISLVWAARPGLPAAAATGVGLLIDELPGATNEILVSKLVGPGTEVRPVVLSDGTPAYWITGGPHMVLYEAPGGDIEQAQGRLAADTLVFNRGELLVRIETAAGLEAALSIADATR